MSQPRILAIMGSGETAPAMMRVHRELLGLLAPDAPAAILDTTYGFQENADDISARMVDAFRDSLGRDFDVASYRSRDIDPLGAARALARIDAAEYLMAGPGSPSFALRQWAGTAIPGAIASKLAAGGIVTMASAAALTLGLLTVPVYEIYKVGADPEWLPGLNLLEPVTGLRVAVVPHYDNAEGGNHDTRYCYLGERRLRLLERTLPDGTFVLGVDGHTALILDLARGTARVAGLGGVTVRAAGRSAVYPTGAEVPVETLAAAARQLARGETPADRPGGAGPTAHDSSDRAAVAVGPGAHPRSPADALEGSVVRSLRARELQAAVAALLDLDLALEARLRSGEDSADLDDARARYRSLVVRLGEAVDAPDDGREAIGALGPVVETILDLRSRARAAGDFPTADRIRKRLVDAGIEVHDGAEGSAWSLAEPAGS